MKTYKALILAASLAGVLATATATAQPADAPEKKQPSDVAEKKQPAELPEKQSPAEQTPEQVVKKPTDEAENKTGAEPDKLLRMNFRGVPLEMVLNYLSDAAGFIIVLETKVEGKVDAWSNQPMSKAEAVDLLNLVLNKNGYAALQNGRTLTIVDRKEAKKRDIRVQVGNNPTNILKNDEMITQIIPVRYANALQLTKDLQPLLLDFANLTANESGNALVLTDTQADVRRMTEIVTALDTSISSISTIRVFPLRFADAKDIANAVKELFAPPASQQNNNNNRNRFFNRFGGGGGGFPGGPGGGGGGADPAAGTGVSEARNAASRVVAVADDRANALVVSAPDEFVPSIEQLVKELDVSVADITELRVFHLLNADPLEMTDLFAQLFPDETKTANDQNQNQFGFRFNRGGFPGVGRANQAPATDTTDRMKKKGRVLAVADQRTSSIIVSAASELMPQIAEMVAQLDSSPAKKQKVFVYSLENADPQQVEQILKTMFERTTTSQNRNNLNQNSALTTRSTATQSPITGSGVGNSGFGTGSGIGNSGGGGRTF